MLEHSERHEQHESQEATKVGAPEAGGPRPAPELCPPSGAWGRQPAGAPQRDVSGLQSLEQRPPGFRIDERTFRIFGFRFMFICLFHVISLSHLTFPAFAFGLDSRPERPYDPSISPAPGSYPPRATAALRGPAATGKRPHQPHQPQLRRTELCLWFPPKMLTCCTSVRATTALRVRTVSPVVPGFPHQLSFSEMVYPRAKWTRDCTWRFARKKVLHNGLVHFHNRFRLFG